MPREIGRRNFIVIIFFLCVALGTTTFFAPHNEGDEIAYLALSHQMGWDLSSYSVRDVDPVNSFPNRLYRAEIFLHPPLFPYMLKLGWKLGSPVMVGLLFNFAGKLLLVWCAYLLSKALKVSEVTACYTAVFVAVCPVVGFVSTRLLTDIWFAVTLISAIYFFASASERGSLWRVFWGSLCVALFLNTKFQAVVYLPLLFGFWLFAACSIYRRDFCSKVSMVAVCGVCVVVVVVFGLGHFFRLYLAYGVDGVRELIYTIERPVGPFVERMDRRSLLKMALYLAILNPWVIALFFPGALKSLFSRIKGGAAAMLVACALVYLAFAISMSTFNQERYWVAFFPLFFVLLASTLENSSSRSGVSLLFIVSLLLLLMNSFVVNVVTPGAITAMVRPVLFQILPMLDSSGGAFYGF